MRGYVREGIVMYIGLFKVQVRVKKACRLVSPYWYWITLVQSREVYKA